jgi:hypothetical protein
LAASRNFPKLEPHDCSKKEKALLGLQRDRRFKGAEKRTTSVLIEADFSVEKSPQRRLFLFSRAASPSFEK